ncbi:CaiB/BaiF CoA transferase family protein [Alkalilacustris brevis]|uniref:CaiB/BaiF CoA transferase family protein n=1 Tax=Alkalilacustris brevis TaxID=2026338 RepID=UPI000E0D335A|nr:CoA transferase [Alkalilacustris brevis]
MTQPLPLAGIRVLDLTQIYNGPYATFLMAMAGAEVIKIEPQDGEYLRRRDASSGAGVPFAMLNACKDSVSLNLKTDKGREIFLQLAETADVVAENFSPGTLDRLGIGWEALSARNPALILASSSGYGQDGPYRDMMAMDITVQAMSGLMSVTGTSDGPPLKTGAAVCDFGGGIHLYGAIMTALFERTRTGCGARIDISMMESVYMTMASNMGMLFGDRRGEIPLRTGNRHGGLSLCPYSVYATSDGHVAIICNSDRHWAALARCMDRADLIDDPRTRHNRDRVAHMEMVDGLIAEFAGRHSTEDLAAMLRRNKVPGAPVRPLPDVMADEALHERGFLHRVNHPDFGEISLPRSPLRMGGAAQAEYRPSPPHAQDNARILGELGVDGAALEELRREGVI